MKEAKDFAESIAAIFIETSARNAVNVEELFQKISECLAASHPPRLAFLSKLPECTKQSEAPFQNRTFFLPCPCPCPCPCPTHEK